MRKLPGMTAFLLVATPILVGQTQAARPVQERQKADYVLSGLVTAVYGHESLGYKEYIVEIKVEQVDKGMGIKKGDTFRAFCYQRKEGKASIEFDSAGHKAVPKEGSRIKVFVFHSQGRSEGCYPDWFDVLPADGK
jgi:hypothetical protein